jgi:hypothetical protein
MIVPTGSDLVATRMFGPTGATSVAAVAWGRAGACEHVLGHDRGDRGDNQRTDQ